MITPIFKKLLIYTTFAASAMLLAGCEEEERALNANPTTSVIGTFEGCDVVYVNRGWNSASFYMAKCPGDSTTLTRNYTTKSGKSTVSRRSTVITQEINALQLEKDQAVAREDALKKLSVDDKVVLGIK